MIRNLAILFLLSLFVAGCGGGEPEPAAPETTTRAPAASTAALEVQARVMRTCAGDDSDFCAEAYRAIARWVSGELTDEQFVQAIIALRPPAAEPETDPPAVAEPEPDPAPEPDPSPPSWEPPAPMEIESLSVSCRELTVEFSEDIDEAYFQQVNRRYNSAGHAQNSLGHRGAPSLRGGWVRARPMGGNQERDARAIDIDGAVMTITLTGPLVRSDMTVWLHPEIFTPWATVDRRARPFSTPERAWWAVWEYAGGAAHYPTSIRSVDGALLAKCALYRCRDGTVEYEGNGLHPETREPEVWEPFRAFRRHPVAYRKIPQTFTPFAQPLEVENESPAECPAAPTEDS